MRGGKIGTKLRKVHHIHLSSPWSFPPLGTLDLAGGRDQCAMKIPQGSFKSHIQVACRVEYYLHPPRACSTHTKPEGGGSAQSVAYIHQL